MLVCCAFFSCCFATWRCALSFSSCGTLTVCCPIAWAARPALPRAMRIARRISAKADEIFDHPAPFATHTYIAHQNKLLVQLESRRGLLLLGARIDRPKSEIEPIKHGVAFCCLTFFEDFSVELLDQQCGRTACQHIVVAC